MKHLKNLLLEKEHNAVTEFKSTLTNKLGKSLLEIKLFGSKAAGYSTPHSDLDLLVIVSEVTVDIKDLIYDVAVEMNLKYDVVISPIIYSKSTFDNDYLKHTYFYKATEQDGISI